MPNAIELPKYKCHKEVWALEIKGIETTFDIKEGEQVKMAPIKCYLHFMDPAYAPIEATDYVAKHRPQSGGYYVVYADSYKSYSPADAFQNGYTLIK